MAESVITQRVVAEAEVPFAITQPQSDLRSSKRFESENDPWSKVVSYGKVECSFEKAHYCVQSPENSLLKPPQTVE